MNGLKLISPMPPSVNHYIAYRAIMKNGRPMAMSYKTPEAYQYQRDFIEYVRREAEAQGWDLEPDPNRHFYIDTVFYFGEKRQDANNYFKVMLDAITETKLIWLDDNVTCERVQAIFYDSKNPRVELYIHPVDYIGVFENASQRDAFTERCIGCTRYKRNCSLLRRALEGRIQPEIKDCVCSRYRSIQAEGKRNDEQSMNKKEKKDGRGNEKNICKRD